MNPNVIKTGDLLLVNGRSTLSRWIRAFMKLYRWKHRLVGRIYSHAGTFIWINSKLYVAEAVENGFRLRLFANHYDFNYDMMILRPYPEYSVEQRLKAEDYALELQEVNNLYEYWALLLFVFYVVFGINLFGKGNKFSLYCYEGAYRILKHVYPQLYPKDPEVVTCFDFYTNQTTLIYRNGRGA